MFKIICKELTNESCDFVAIGETLEQAKDVFYKHGAESELHKEKYYSASEAEKAAFWDTLDKYLAEQK